MRVNVILFSAQPVWAAGMGHFLDRSQQFRVVATISKLSCLDSAPYGVAPDLVLVDFDRECQVQAVDELCAAFPRAKVVVAASGIPPEVAFHLRETGVTGILDTRMDCNAFLDALSHVARGHVVFDAKLMGQVDLLKRFHLTPREGQVVSLLAQGFKNKEIAFSLGISEGTLKVYLSKLFQKVGAKDRLELALFGVRNLTAARKAAAPAPLAAIRLVSSNRIPESLGTLAVFKGPAAPHVPDALIA